MEMTSQYKKYFSYNNLEEYIPLFEDHEISDETFVQLTKDDISKIVDKIGPMLKIEQIVKYMASGSGDQSFWLFWICVAICYLSFVSWYFGFWIGFGDYSKAWVKKFQEFFRVKNEKFSKLKASLTGFTGALWLGLVSWYNKIINATRISRTTATNYQKPLQSSYRKPSTVLQNQKPVGLPGYQKYSTTNYQMPKVSYVSPPIVSNNQKLSVLQNQKPAALPQNQKQHQAPNQYLQNKEYLYSMLLNSIKQEVPSSQPGQNSKLFKPLATPAKQQLVPEEPSKKKDPVKENPQIVQKVKSKDAQEQKTPLIKLGLEPEVASKIMTRNAKKDEQKSSLKNKENLDPKLKKVQKPKKSSKKVGRKYK